MNALKHGCDAAPENEAAVMRALGEDPVRYAALQRELATTYGPGDALWDYQVADLGKLYWRRNRLERMETGLMRRALPAVEERQRARRDQIAAVTLDASNRAATEYQPDCQKRRCSTNPPSLNATLQQCDNVTTPRLGMKDILAS